MVKNEVNCEILLSQNFQRIITKAFQKKFFFKKIDETPINQIIFFSQEIIQLTTVVEIHLLHVTISHMVLKKS